MTFRIGALSLAVFSLAALLTGCAGYRMGSIGGKNIQGITSVYVPVAKNTVFETGIDVPVTTQIIKAFDQDGTLTTTQNEVADSELDVTVTKVERTMLQYERQDVQAGNQFEVALIAQVTYLNRKTWQKVFDRVLVHGKNTYFVQRDQVESERQALAMAEQDLAKNVVSLVVEGW
jgi:hypothetical protein